MKRYIDGRNRTILSNASKKNKSDLRAQLRVVRANIPAETRCIASLQIARHLAGFIPLLTARTIALYAPHDGEIDPFPIIHWRDTVLPSSVRICYPRVTGETAMDFYKCDTSDLVPGYNEILEPPTTAKLVHPAEIDLMLVPGLGFTPGGQRLGYGRGFYDRYLAGCASAALVTLGLSYTETLLVQLPTNKYDILLDYVVSPKQLT